MCVLWCPSRSANPIRDPFPTPIHNPKVGSYMLHYGKEKKRKTNAHTLYRHECEPVTQMFTPTKSWYHMRGYASFRRWALWVLKLYLHIRGGFTMDTIPHHMIGCFEKKYHSYVLWCKQLPLWGRAMVRACSLINTFDFSFINIMCQKDMWHDKGGVFIPHFYLLMPRLLTP